MPEIEKNMLWLIFSKCLKVRRAREMEGEGFTSVCNPISSWFQAVWSSVKRNTLWSCGPNELWVERGKESRISLLTSSPLFIDCSSDELKKEKILLALPCSYGQNSMICVLINCTTPLSWYFSQTVAKFLWVTHVFCDYLNFKLLNMHVNCIKNLTW